MAAPIHNVPAPRTLSVAAFNRQNQELNKQLARLQQQVSALAARVAALEAR
jgi:prefoldin subunit 5